MRPTPRATDGTKGGPNQRGSSGDLMLPSAIAQLPPTPTATDANSTANFRPDGTPYGSGYGPTLLDAVRLLSTPLAADGGPRGSSAGWGLRNEVRALLPTPTAADGERTSTTMARGNPTLRGAVLPLNTSVDWGQFALAVARWERVMDRPAPDPKDERGRLAPAFVEWMQGLPAGWVTDVPGLSRNDILRILGNGVVPAQCAAALPRLLAARANALVANGELAA